MDSWESIIGLEIHIELKTKSKMFCRCSADYFGHQPNTHVCPICLGLPGALPVANKKAIEWTVLAGKALNCQIPLFSKFDRKNYFYPDLPKGYQISQYDLPLAINGELKFKIGNLKLKIRIKRVHLEEDTAKMIHTGKATLLDFNRSGVPLMEIVTEPDIRSPQEAKKFLKKLQQVIRYLGISDCDLEKGSMRCEANVSVRRRLPAVSDQALPSYKVEIKNLNSFRFVKKALAYEIERQIKLFQQDEEPIQETRGWDEVKQVTRPQRIKEEAQDYRYFPEPDLPPIRWTQKELSVISRQLPELPDEKTARFQKKYHLSFYQAQILAQTQEKADYFEEAVKIGKKYQISPQKLANVIINKRVDFKKILPAELIKILVKKKRAPRISEEELEKLIDQVLAQHPQAVADYQKGKKEAVGFLLGQVMRLAQKKIDPIKTKALILKKLND